VRLGGGDGDAAGGDGREVRGSSGTSRGGGDREGVEDSFDDDDGPGRVEGVVGGSVDDLGLVEGGGPGRVAVLGGSGVAGGVAADEAADPVVGVGVGDGDDDAVAQGVDEASAPCLLGEVHGEQLVTCHPAVTHGVDEARPAVAGLADHGGGVLGAPWPHVDASMVQEVVLGEAHVD